MAAKSFRALTPITNGAKRFEPGDLIMLDDPAAIEFLEKAGAIAPWIEEEAPAGKTKKK